jgi:hypothetical protein
MVADRPKTGNSPTRNAFLIAAVRIRFDESRGKWSIVRMRTQGGRKCYWTFSSRLFVIRHSRRLIIRPPAAMAPNIRWVV